MAPAKLYGPNWSAYVRTARLVFIEKEVPYELVEVDFSSAMPADHLLRHPFGKVPALEHGDFRIYETSAVCRYIDAAFDGRSLQPSRAQDLGRMAQIIAILDAYLSEPIRMGMVNERLIKPMLGMAVDAGLESRSRSAIKGGFQALCDCIGDGPFMVGNELSLADLHAAPLIDYLSMTPGGDELISDQPRLANWWAGVEARASIANTKPDLTVFKEMGAHSNDAN